MAAPNVKAAFQSSINDLFDCLRSFGDIPFTYHKNDPPTYDATTGVVTPATTDVDVIFTATTIMDSGPTGFFFMPFKDEQIDGVNTMPTDVRLITTVARLIEVGLTIDGLSERDTVEFPASTNKAARVFKVHRFDVDTAQSLVMWHLRGPN